MNIIMCKTVLLWFWLLQYKLCLVKLRNNGQIVHPYIVLVCQLWAFTYVFNCMCVFVDIFAILMFKKEGMNV